MKATHTIPVTGAALTVGTWGAPDAPAVLAIHGISATHMCWNTLARITEEEFRIIAPDLRGRGQSTDAPGPYGMAAHARDLAAVLAELGVERAIVVGHSMGAFAAQVFAHLHPERVAGVVLVDGGLPIPPPPGLSTQDITDSILAPIEARLAAPVASREAYLAAWRAHPAFADLSADLLEYIEYDLISREGELWASGNLEAIRTDGQTLIGDPDLSQALTDLAAAPGEGRPVPYEFLRAEYGMMIGGPPLYPAPEAEALGKHFAVPVTTVDEVNHYTIVMGERGAGAIRQSLRGLQA